MTAEEIKALARNEAEKVLNAGYAGRIFVDMVILDKATGEKYFQKDVFQLSKFLHESEAKSFVEEKAKSYARDFKNRVKSKKNPNPDTVLESVKIVS